jgi:hypothetical protein
MAIALIAAVVGAVVGAIVGAYFQRRWTPDYSAKLAALSEQFAALQRQNETLEQQRAEAEHLRLDMSLQQAYCANYIVLVENDSDREITMEKMALFRDGVWLCEMCQPKADGGLNVAPHTRKQVRLEPQNDPARTLMSMDPDLPPGKCIQVELVLDYGVFGRPRQFRKKILITADLRNHKLTQWSP